MEAFDPRSKCPKCGSKDISTQWCRGGELRWNAAHGQCPSGEHMDRTCKRCGHLWPEACMDAEQA